MSEQPDKPTTMGLNRTYLCVLFSQLISLLGSALTEFGVGVWTYQQTGSVLQYSLIVVCVVVPGLLAMPWAGVVADRWDRRVVMIAADTGAALCTAAIGGLLWCGRLEVWHIYLFNGLASVCQAFQRPALDAAVATLVDKDELGRANGLRQLAGAIPVLIAPLLAGFLIGPIGLTGIIVIDLVSFAVATCIMFTVRFQVLKASATEPDFSVGSTLRDFAEAFRFLRGRRVLALLMGYFAMEHFLVGLVSIMLVPTILTTHSEAALGTILTVGGVGALVGALTMTVWGGPKRLVVGILGFDLLLGLAVATVGVGTFLPLLGACTLVGFLCVSLVDGCDQVLWQHKVPLGLQGRVFALRDAIVTGSLPAAALIGGILADRVFGPWLMPGGALADSLGAWIGVGPGRGMGAMFVGAGGLTVLLAFVGLTQSRLRRLDLELPDAF